MARTRHSSNPAKVKAQINALKRGDPAAASGRQGQVRRQASIVLLCVLTVVLLSVCFAPFDQWYFAYVAAVPWLVGLMRRGRKRTAILWGTLTGTLFWAANLYWLWWVTLVGYGAMVVYLSLYWLVAALLLRSASGRNWPMWIVFPVVWVALEYARAHVISGLPWFFLAHSQYQQVRLIQVADVTGQYGVSFFVAMVNGVLADLLMRRQGQARFSRGTIQGVAATVLTCGALLGYGTWRLGQATTSPGPVIALVQEAFPISLRGSSATPEKILDSHMGLSEMVIGSGCDLVVMPETMLPMAFNAEFHGMDVSKIPPEAVSKWARRFCPPKDREVYADRLGDLLSFWQRALRGEKDSQGVRRLEKLSRSLRCPILAGGPSLHLNRQPIDADDHWLVKNSAMGFDGNWQGPVRRALWGVAGDGRFRFTGKDLGAVGYSKAHLVPFGEYVPFKRSATWLHRALRWFVPAAMDQLEPGRRLGRFELTRSGPDGAARTWRLATPICYEGTFARVCRRMVAADGRKMVDILVNMSNDGWFVWRRFRRVGPRRGSTEHRQHLAQYCFRAVETRTPVVRAVNTGISASIDSNGRIISVLSKDERETMIRGVLLLGGTGPVGQDVQPGPRVLVDSRFSVYSRIGDVFAIVVGLVGMAVAAWLAFRRPRTPDGEAK